jgi:hypothetical protein
VWPLAIAEIVRESENATLWSRLHARQALVFGVVVTVGYAILMALPLLFVIVLSGIDTGATVLLYGVGIVLDFAGAVVLLWAALHYYNRTARGELFRIPLVTAIADRVFRLDPE